MLITLERTGKTKNAEKLFEPYYREKFSPNLSQNGWKLDAHELKTCAPFREKAQNTFRDVLSVKSVFTYGSQENGSAYFIPIALKRSPDISVQPFIAVRSHARKERSLARCRI